MAGRIVIDERADRLGPLRARVRRRRPARAARQAPARPRGDRAGLRPRRARRRRGLARRLPRAGRPRHDARSRRGCSTRARSRASATCSPTRRCGARGCHPRRPAGSLSEDELDQLRRVLRAATRARSARAACTPAPSSPTARRGGHCPRCRTRARAGHDRRPHDVLVPHVSEGLTRRSSNAARAD